MTNQSKSDNGKPITETPEIESADTTKFNQEAQDISALLEAAETAINAGNCDRIENVARTVLQIPKTADTSSDVPIATALRVLGMVAEFRNEYTVALEHLNASWREAEMKGDKASCAKASANLGYVYWSRSHNALALEKYHSALRLFKELGDKTGMLKMFGNIGTIHLELSNYDQAMDFFTVSMTLSQELGNKRGYSSTLCNIGNTYKCLSDYTQALDCFTKALAIDEELGDKAGVARNYGNIGIVYRSISDYTRSLEYYARALALTIELGERTNELIWLSNIGNVYLGLADYERAMAYYSKALLLAEELGNKSGVSINLGNIGVVHWNRLEYDEALDFFGKAVAIDEEIGSKERVASNQGNIGTVHMSMGEFAKAQEYLQKCLYVTEELGQRAEAAATRGRIGNLNANPSNPARDEVKAEEYLLESISLSNELGTKNYETHRVLAGLYERQERWQESLIQFKKYHDLEQEVKSEEAKKSAALLEQRKQIAEREKEIELAKAAATARLNATTTLLHKVLPETIATRMIEGEQDIADYFPQVSILFADIAGFTPLSADMPASVVVRFLNHVFREFDRIMKKHGCEKIKTIGDGYMAVAGAPLECADHAERIAAAALEMQETISLPEDIREHLPTGASFGVRIGLHTGSVVAGVIGDERFVYDVYSDAVNTASRMESHGEASRIHVSQDFYRHMQNRFSASKNTTHGLIFEKRGEMEIKGKGLMRTYFLEKT